jgi:hypothetical protein
MKAEHSRQFLKHQIKEYRFQTFSKLKNLDEVGDLYNLTVPRSNIQACPIISSSTDRAWYYTLRPPTCDTSQYQP